ncbi:MAG: HAD family hydrolase [Nitrospirae bacterium]|nr:MAG: HAD family hydrolase [Nitrospirota bacterium]
MRHLHDRVTIFLDRDGTLNHDIGYVTSPDALTLFDDAVDAVRRLNHAGSQVILVTNQSAVGRGLMSLADLDAIHRRLKDMLRAGGAHLDGIVFCPHQPEAGCRCRKPASGLIDQAATIFDIDMHRSYVIGDKRTDMELAVHVGAVGVLVTTSPFGQQALREVETGRLCVGAVASNLSGAVDWILENSRMRLRQKSVGS